jgi:RteC protein
LIQIFNYFIPLKPPYSQPFFNLEIFNMKAYTENLHLELLSKLDIMDKNYDPQNLSDPRLGLIASAIDQIKEKLKMHTFKHIEDEVYFFKFVLPSTLALYIYYLDKIEWGRIIRQGSPECRYKFTDRIYSQAETFRKDNQLFCEYYRDGKKDLDNFYFLRNSPVNRETKYQVRRIIDPSSPPLHCEILANLIAHTKMEHELKMVVAVNSGELSPIKPGKLKLRWTGKQIDLIELGYGLKETGSLNDGKASLKDIFDFFEESFEIDLGNTSRLFQDIIGRKAGNTVYLDLMRKKLIQRIEDVLN